MEEKKQEVKEHQLIQGPSTFKIEIPENVEAKIRHLCSRVHDVEWSGTLFYKVEGSMEDSSFKVICLDIFVMDIGTSGFTDYDDSPEIIQYRVAHKDTLLQPGVYEGLIHSHNNMATFFSGTDTNTLKQEGNTQTHFVSLIVNNAGNYTARITRKLVKKVKAEAHVVYTENSFYNSFENSVIKLAEDTKTSKDLIQEKENIAIEWFPLDIIKADVTEQFKDVDIRLNAIRAAKTKAKAPVYTRDLYFSKDPMNIQTARSAIAFSQEIKTPERNLVKNSQPVQSSLFPEMEEKPVNPHPLALLEGYDESIIKSLCVQLLTGCILASDENKINLDEWVNNMDDTYEKRFGSLEDSENYTAVELWVANMVDCLVYTRDEDFENMVSDKYGDAYDADDISEVCAYDMVRFLEKLPGSLVKEIMIEELYNYIPNVKDYI